jgi:hypothetical protein
MMLTYRCGVMDSLVIRAFLCNTPGKITGQIPSGMALEEVVQISNGIYLASECESRIICGEYSLSFMMHSR